MIDCVGRQCVPRVVSLNAIMSKVLCFAVFECKIKKASHMLGKMIDMPTKFYTVKEVAAILRVNERTVLNLIAAGDLRATQVGRQYRISEEQLQDYIARHS